MESNAYSNNSFKAKNANSKSQDLGHKDINMLKKMQRPPSENKYERLHKRYEEEIERVAMECMEAEVELRDKSRLMQYQKRKANLSEVKRKRRQREKFLKAKEKRRLEELQKKHNVFVTPNNIKEPPKEEREEQPNQITEEKASDDEGDTKTHGFYRDSSEDETSSKRKKQDDKDSNLESPRKKNDSRLKESDRIDEKSRESRESERSNSKAIGGDLSPIKVKEKTLDENHPTIEKKPVEEPKQPPQQRRSQLSKPSFSLKKK